MNLPPPPPVIFYFIFAFFVLPKRFENTNQSYILSVCMFCHVFPWQPQKQVLG